MATQSFDPGYGRDPYRSLVDRFPGQDVYPPADFRTEWGPIFHRGRLDGSARVLVVGQDPATHEAVCRRILVGEAGQRVQGLLRRLGVTSSYVMVNALLYSVYGQSGGNQNVSAPAIVAYRHRWFDALAHDNDLQVILALGRLAETAVRTWRPSARITCRSLSWASASNQRWRYATMAGAETFWFPPLWP